MTTVSRLRLLLLLGCFLVAPVSRATTYYICAVTTAPCNASDGNPGTSKTATWLHAPGMPNCTGVCASTIPAAGDNFIFHGGDTWHFGSGSPLIGTGGWTWTRSGTSGSRIYIGTDQTWFSGGAFARPVLNFDNPLSTSFVGSCSFNDDGFVGVLLSNVNFVTFDDFEFRGFCENGTTNSYHIFRTGTNVFISNCYFHGWTEVQGTGKDNLFIIGGQSGTSTDTHNDIFSNTIDGSDAHCVTSNDCIAWTLRDDSPHVYKNTIRKIANGFNSPGNIVDVHDNWFDQLFDSYDVPNVHSGIIESFGAVSGVPIRIYNNLFTNTNISVGIWPEPTAANLYEFNNVMLGWGHDAAGTNCFMVDGQGTGGTAVSVFITNNTFDAPCVYRFYGAHAGQEFKGTGTFQNNHYIGYSPASLSSTFSIDGGAAGTTTIVDNDKHVFQTEVVANGQGYVPGNHYAPTSGSNATVGTGANLTSSCSTYSADSALCSGTSAGLQVATIPRPTTGVWDVGAYQFAASGSPAVSLSPTSLAFGNQPINITSSAQNMTLTNSGTATLTITSITLTGTNASDYTISSNGCGASLGQGLNCVVGVTFKPTTVGSRTANLTFTTNASTSPDNAALSGTGQAPIASFSPTSLSFGGTKIGLSSLSQAVILTNTGNATMSISSISLAGTNPADYSQNNTCGATLVINANCQINITFTPLAIGTRTANVSVSSNTVTSPDTVLLGGIGFFPVIGIGTISGIGTIKVQP